MESICSVHDQTRSPHELFTKNTSREESSKIIFFSMSLLALFRKSLPTDEENKPTTTRHPCIFDLNQVSILPCLLYFFMQF